MPGIAETVHVNHIKAHCDGSHPNLNPTGIIPKGPDLDFNQPHGREGLVGWCPIGSAGAPGTEAISGNSDPCKPGAVGRTSTTILLA